MTKKANGAKLAPKPRDRTRYDAGRSRSGKHTSPVVPLVCPAELLEQVDADRGETSRSEWIREAIRLRLAAKGQGT